MFWDLNFRWFWRCPATALVAGYFDLTGILHRTIVSVYITATKKLLVFTSFFVNLFHFTVLWSEFPHGRIREQRFRIVRAFADYFFHPDHIQPCLKFNSYLSGQDIISFVLLSWIAPFFRCMISLHLQDSVFIRGIAFFICMSPHFRNTEFFQIYDFTP
mgnify:FL=1